MRDALERVKRELGPDAVILGTRTLPAGGLGALAGRQSVEITASPPGAVTPVPRVRGRTVNAPSAAPTSVTPEPVEARIPKCLYPHYVRLVQHEVAEELAAQLVRRAASRVPEHQSQDAAALRGALREFIAEMVPTCGGVGLTTGTLRRVALVGPPGGGKTTTIAKLAAQFGLRQGRRVALLSLDMHRLGAHEQLRRYAELIDVPFHTAQTISEVKRCLQSLESVDSLLIDTPGIGLREQGRFARLATLLRAARPDETHLVLPVSLTPEVQTRIAQSLAPLKSTRVVLTRLDDVIGFGVVLNVMHRLNLGVSYLSAGQNVPHDIEEGCSQRLAELLCAVDD